MSTRLFLGPIYLTAGNDVAITSGGNILNNLELKPGQTAIFTKTANGWSVLGGD